MFLLLSVRREREREWNSYKKRELGAAAAATGANLLQALYPPSLFIYINIHRVAGENSCTSTGTRAARDALTK